MIYLVAPTFEEALFEARSRNLSEGSWIAVDEHIDFKQLGRITLEYVGDYLNSAWIKRLSERILREEPRIYISFSQPKPTKWSISPIRKII